MSDETGKISYPLGHHGSRLGDQRHGALGPVRDVTASSSWGLYLVAIFCILGGILILAVRPPFGFGKEKAIFKA
jgi:hypothetical protein